MFSKTVSYTRKEIQKHIGGQYQYYLPTKNGQVVGACLDKKHKDPDAPDVILVGVGRFVEYHAQILRDQKTPIPVFIKQATNDYRFNGMFSASRLTKDPREIAHWAGRSTRRDPVTAVLFMDKVS